MTPESGLVAGTREVAEEPVRPELSGWAGAASAIHAIQQMPVPMTLHLDVAEHGTIVIDFPFHAFAWETPFARFPAEPSSVLVETRTAHPEQPSIALPGRQLDALLWMIGYTAFGDQPAPWLRPGDRYRLRRWPALAELNISIDQVRMTAMLGNAFATADELAAAAHTPPSDARRLVNAFSLTGILRRSTGAPALEAAASAGAAEASGAGAAGTSGTTGLFSRLRERLGR